jgi:hypothetical protein
MICRRLLLLGIGVAAQAALAQPARYQEVTTERLPVLLGQCMDAAAGDADGDGDLDLALAMEFEPNILLLNDGRGRFQDASAQLPRAVHDSEDIAFADFDRDGDLDLVLVSEDDRQDELYLNDGTGRFQDASARLPAGATSNALAVIDLDADGAPDLLIGNIGTNRVLINDGSGGFADRTEARWPQSGPSRTQDLELADVDKDGDLDVIVANEGQNQLFINTDGRLIDETMRRLPQGSDESREIRTGDVDGDGDLDLVVANVDFLLGESPRDLLLLNDGNGVFEDAGPEAFPEDSRNNFTVQLADLDGDDDLDALLPATDLSPTGRGDYLVLVNDGRGRFARSATERLLPVAANGNGFDIELADFDGDGARELFLCHRASNPAAPDSSGGRQRLLALQP